MGRILVGVDGTSESRAALDYAAKLARETGRELFLAYVAEPPLPFDLSSAELSASSEAETRAWGCRLLERLAREEKSAGLAVGTTMLRGPPATMLADAASAEEIDLVVVGHRGRNAVARALLGSVADRLAQICPKPVLVVR